MRKNQYFSLIFVIFWGIMLFGLTANAATTPRITIDQGKSVTYDRKVQLNLVGPDNVKQMMVANNPVFSDVDWESFKANKTWYLDYGRGEKSIYVKFKDRTNNITIVYSDSIRLEPPAISADFIFYRLASSTDSRYVNITNNFSAGIDSYRISNDKDFGDTAFKNIVSSTSWVLSKGAGKKTVYIQYKDASGDTITVSKMINYILPRHYILEGTVVKGQGNTIYYFGNDGFLHPYLNPSVYNSWYRGYDSILSVSDSRLRQYKIGNPVCLRQGTWLIKFTGSSQMYAVEPACTLRPIRSEVEAYVLYGANWAKRVLELDPLMQTYYNITSFNVADRANKIYDRDADGISAADEKDFGSSDVRVDTDQDKLSDYEEINYWYSDPNDPDTDGDSYGDGQEILNGYSPLDNEKLGNIPTSTYDYPIGSVVFEPAKKGSGTYYYILGLDTKYTIGHKITDKNFVSKNFQEKFVINPPIKIVLPKKSSSIGKINVITPQVVDSKGKVIDL